MIKDYLNQQASWEQKNGHNAAGEPQFDPPIDIRVRWEWQRSLVRDTEGREVVSEARVFAVDPIKPGDRLTDPLGNQSTVISVSGHPGFDGEFVYREAAV